MQPLAFNFPATQLFHTGSCLVSSTRNLQEIPVNLSSTSYCKFLWHIYLVIPQCLNDKVMMQNTNQPPLLEITIISAQDLKKKASFPFSHRLRPFITLSTTIATTSSSSKHAEMYKTGVDKRGGINPRWGDKFKLSLDRAFFYQRYPGVYLQLYTKHLLMGQSQLGWCLIPASDIVSQFSPVGSIQFLSYRLRARDGSRGHGVVNVSVKLEGSLGMIYPSRPLISNAPHQHEHDQSVIGIPANL